MPILLSSVPKYRYHRASGQAIVTLAGKDHYLGPHGTKASKLNYDRLVGEWLASGRPSAPAAPAYEITVAEVCLAFLKHAKRYYVKNGHPTGTADTYKPVVKLLRERYGRTAAAEFGPLALKALQAAMIDLGECRRYVNDNAHRIKRIFRWAASEQLIPASVPTALGTVEGLRAGHSEARETEPIGPVDDAVVDATLPHLPLVVADLVRLQRFTGMRPNEVCQLRPADIDRGGDVWRFVPREHKTQHHGKRRVVFIGPAGQTVLLPYLLRSAEGFCFTPEDSERKRREIQHANRQTPLSCGNVPGSNRKGRPKRKPGDRYGSSSYRRAIHRACAAAEVEQWSPNRLRHSTATMIRQRFGIEAAQVTLGHSRLNTTELYAVKNQELAERIAREVG